MNSGQEYQQLADDNFIYRALLRQSWINEDTGRVKRDAYYLRFDRGEIGLSVNVASACTPEACATRFRSCYGIARLKVGDVRSTGLDVLRDSLIHANILGLPYRENDRLGADHFSRLLAQCSEIIWRPE
jgi:hypothetical protein